MYNKKKEVRRKQSIAPEFSSELQTNLFHLIFSNAKTSLSTFSLLLLIETVKGVLSTTTKKKKQHFTTTYNVADAFVTGQSTMRRVCAKVRIAVSRRAVSTKGTGEARDVSADDAEDWLNRQVNRRVEEGKITNEAAAYFAELRQKKPELGRFTRQARNLIAVDDPERLTRYQQQQISEKLRDSVSHFVAENLQKKFKEENEMKLYQQEGVPTGQNYWMEAGDVLLDPSVPAWIRDEILAEMQQGRPSDSPAFQEVKPLSKEEMDAAAAAAAAEDQTGGSDGIDSAQAKG